MASALRDDKRFVRWAFADGISVTGTAISNVVLPLVVYEATGSSAATGGLFALRRPRRDGRRDQRGLVRLRQLLHRSSDTGLDPSDVPHR